MGVSERTADPFVWLTGRDGVLADVVTFLGFIVLLSVVMLTQVPDAPGFVTGWRISIAFVLFGLLAATISMFCHSETDAWLQYLVLVGGAILLIEWLFRYRAPEFSVGNPGIVELFAFYLLLFIILLVYPDVRTFSRAQWLFISCIGVVVGLFFYHTLPTGPETLAPTWPLWASVVAGINLLLIPRFVPEYVFLWAIALVATVTAIVGTAGVIIGEYSWWFFEVTRHPQEFPMTATEPAGWYGYTSIFNNVNVFGLVTFAGLVASVFLLHRAWRRRTILIGTLAGALVISNGAGLLVSSSDAAWLAAGVSLGFYSLYVVLGRRAILPGFVTLVTAAVVSVLAVYHNILPIDPGSRFVRWRSGVGAIRAAPSLLGHGHVSTAEFTAPYLEGMTPDEPHNSYLDITIRTGFLGLLAYVVLFLGGLLYGALRYRTINVAMLAFAFGWAVHHLFESYTMIQLTIPAVLSSLALGYLLFGDTHAPADVLPAEDSISQPRPEK